MEKIMLFDTTLRDGEQSPGCSMNLSEKLEVARALRDLRVDIIEAGFPVTSPGDFDAVAAIAAEVQGPIIAAFARADPDHLFNIRNKDLGENISAEHDNI